VEKVSVPKQDLRKLLDNRGSFLKVYDSKELFKLENISEIFITKSKKFTLRGMHYQKKPYQINRIVTCLSGEVLDVVVNINPKSKNFKKTYAVTLYENQSVFVSKDYAHGFYALSDCELLYLTDNIYSKDYEDGFLWESISFVWPNNNPILSDRDKSFVSL